ncbi:UDP-glucose 4-epimerase GalE [Sphingomonas sp. RG327]|uniref:UDP-glucose 4-epimerase n=1 Tax=Sphingomonas anseongensis TaxID=2908207 RepID=A0ABT0RGW0_9SPHN|nr:UDP-glucose 4-epimerase GalE [Sphingomonas anseongensis]MCL6679481.1 UDP-glucose 4-epimerase GalE [Sphingomonas anseongensis]
MSKVPVLVTGGAGYIGSHAVLALKDSGWPVAIIDDLSNGSRIVVPGDVPFYEGNIADRSLVERILAEQKIGAIMHFAGSIVVPESVTNPLAYYGNNTVATHALISAAVAGGVRHILFSSTAAVYGAPETIPVDEDAAKAPINPYGASKLMTEWMLADCSAAYGFNYGALRYFNVSGADRELRSGQIGKGSTHLIKIAVEAATGKRDHVDVFGSDYPTPDGTCIRDYIHVSDLADAHVLALQRLIDAPDENLLLNCGYGRGLSVLEVLDALDRQLNEPIRREMKPRRAGDPPALVAGNARLLKALAWTPRFNDIETIVRDALEWERKLETIQAAT